MSEKSLNLMLPGNPRYQPRDLKPLMGYDMLARYYVEVELTVLAELAHIGVIPAETYALLTPEVERAVLAITTSEVDKLEREVTGHDIRALVQLMQEHMPEKLRPWVHVPLTSYDVIDTARALMFYRTHKAVIAPKVREVLALFAEQITEYAHDLQIGRTHGQHAVPITIGFWLATVAHRILDNLGLADDALLNLEGKIAGPVGAKNALTWLAAAFPSKAEGLRSLQESVGDRLGIPMAYVSTQIVPPEALAEYLHALVLLSGSFAQFANDCRHLMRSEIAEVAEEFEATQVGSSTMAHKRNPITFEGIVGAHTKTVAEYGKVLATLVSEHQRDLTASSVMRDYPTIVVNLVSQLDALLRLGKKNKKPFLARLRFDRVRAAVRAERAREAALAEPLYLLLQTAGGFTGDAHSFVNHLVVPRLGPATTMLESVELMAPLDTEFAKAWRQIPEEARALFTRIEPDTPNQTIKAYAGESAALAKKVVESISLYLDS